MTYIYNMPKIHNMPKNYYPSLFLKRKEGKIAYSFMSPYFRRTGPEIDSLVDAKTLIYSQ